MTGVYQWSEGARLRADPNAVGAEIERLSAASPDRQLTPQALVEAARQSNGPLHFLFVWDDAEAASLQRVEHARFIIRSLTVVVTMTPKAPSTPMRAFVNVVKNDQQGYRSLSSAMEDPELRGQVVQRAWNELLSWRNRYGQYQELATACAAVAVAVRKRDEAVAKLEAA